MEIKQEIAEIEREIRDELERGINRNNILPLDWAMDRIRPILEEAIKSTAKLLLDDEIEFLEELMHHDIGINKNVKERLSQLQKQRSEIK